MHPVTVAIEHSDALMEDNRRSIAVDVIREIRVLLVDGQPGSEPLEGETDYLAVALSPYAFGGEDQPDAVRTSVIQTGQVEQQLAEGLPDVMVLANVETLSLQARREIAQFVLQGGDLVVFDGQQLDPNAYNEPWVCDQGSWTLPSKLGAIIELFRGDGEDSSAKPTQAVGAEILCIPLGSCWGRPTNSPLPTSTSIVIANCRSVSPVQVRPSRAKHLRSVLMPVHRNLRWSCGACPMVTRWRSRPIADSGESFNLRFHATRSGRHFPCGWFTCP